MLEAVRAILDGSHDFGAEEKKPPAAGSKAHVLLGVRNFVVRELVAIYGRQGATDFCGAFLDPQRWKRLRRDCFREA